MVEGQKNKYRVRNWGEYNKSLVKRGDIRIFLDNEVWEAWQKADPKKKAAGKRRTRIR